MLKEPQSVEIPIKTQVFVFLTLAFAWFLLIQSALQQQALYWFPYLYYSRILLFSLSLVFALITWLRRNQKNFLFLYCIICMFFQASFAVLERADQIEYYQYIAYFMLISALSLSNNFTYWMKRFLPLALITLIVPLFFKNSSYFSSVGQFVFHFTTAVALFLLSLIVARINAGKYEAIQKNILLQKQLLDSERITKERVEKELEKAKMKIETSARLTAKAALAAQVVHDIRSPLACLLSVLHHSNGIDEDTRNMIHQSTHRIKEIANHLSSHFNKDASENSHSIEAIKNIPPISIQLISTLVDSTLNQKRFQFLGFNKTDFIFNLSEKSYGLFARVHATEFSRLLSNLIDNAVEAIEDTQLGKIEISLDSNNTYIFLTITDNGRGISPQAIGKLGEIGETYGKANGLGLGLYHARTTLESWGGKLELNSSHHRGTTVTLLLPKAPSPTWFAQGLKVKPNSWIAVLDDDLTIHEQWRKKIHSLKNDTDSSIEKSREKLNSIHFNTINEMMDWYRKNLDSEDQVFYICDHEISGDTRTGLDVIRMLGIQNNSVLMVGQIEEPQIRDQCEKLGVRILPKSLASHVPVDASLV